VAILSLVSWTVGARAGQSPADVEARIRRVEANLRPIVRGTASADPKTLAGRMKALGVPGVSVAVIDGGEVAWARGYGVKEVGDDDPVTPETLFQAASISKPVAAVAALRLVERGALDLDADVNESLTGWKVPEAAKFPDAKVTLRRLLSHSAGFGDRFGFPGYEAGATMPTLPQILDGLPPANTAPRAVRIEHEPGVAFRYSGGGYCVVQMLIEEATGRPFAEHVADDVLGPTGMERSTFVQPLPEDRAKEAAAGHYGGLAMLAKGRAKVKGRWHVYPEQAAAGLWTTPTDLARLAIAIQRADAGAPGAVLGPEMADAMLTPQRGGWGLGVGLSGEGTAAGFNHGGSNEGFICMLVAVRGCGQGAVVMTNSSSGGEIAMELLHAIAAEYDWTFEP
jgi:CubicO group peptidase (beta-lactamase class C family)